MQQSHNGNQPGVQDRGIDMAMNKNLQLTHLTYC